MDHPAHRAEPSQSQVSGRDHQVPEYSFWDSNRNNYKKIRK